MTTIYDIKKELVQKLKDKWLNLSDKKYSPKEIYVNAYPNNKTIGVKKTTTFIVIWQGSDIGTPFISGTKYWHETNIVIEVITVPGKMVKYDNLNEQQDYIIENTKKFMNEFYKNGTYYNQIIYKGEKTLNDNNPILGSWQFRTQIFYLAEYLGE